MFDPPRLDIGAIQPPEVKGSAAKAAPTFVTMFDAHPTAHRIGAAGKMEKTNKNHDPFGARATLNSKAGDFAIYRLGALAQRGIADINKLPFSVKVLLESALRNRDEFEVTSEDVRRLAAWNPKVSDTGEVPF